MGDLAEDTLVDDLYAGSDSIDDSEPQDELDFGDDPALSVVEDDTAEIVEDDIAEIVEDDTAEIVEDDTEVQRPILVPKDRMDTEIAKRRALEDEVSKLRGQLTPEGDEIPLGDNNAEALSAALLDGDTERFNELYSQDRQSIARDVAAQLRQEFETGMTENRSMTRAEIELEVAARDVESKYEIFNDSSPQFDETLSNELVAMRDFYIQQGRTPADALSFSVRNIAAREGFGEGAGVAAPAPAPADVAGKIKAKAAQPPSLAGKSNSSEAAPVVDVFTMTDADLDDLSDKQLAEMRGDFL